MKRRHFLGAAAAGLAASTWPAFLREAFGDGVACETDAAAGAAKTKGATQVAAAFRRAQQARRPLLVFVIPAADGMKWERGHAFGELLNHGADKDLAPLSDVEVVCATMADLKKIVPAAGSGEPLMVLVKTDKVPATAAQLDAPLPEYPDSNNGHVSWDELKKQDDQVTARRIAVVAGLLRSALGNDERKLAARAASVRARLTKQAPAGTHWANGSGCGTTVEGVEDNMVMGCGMGHVPEKSRRFLYFFSTKDSLI